MEPSPAQIRDTGELPPLNSRLTPCPDCGRPCSLYAEHCPQCGRFFRRYGEALVIDRRNWVTTIAGGIVLGWVMISIIAGAVLVVLLILGIGLSLPVR